MDYSLAKGISPGKVISRELKKRKLSQRVFAKTINIHSQTLNAVINNNRKLTIEMSLKIEKELQLPEGTLMMLQVYYLIEEFKNNNKSVNSPGNIPKLRKILFWDTDITKIDWYKQKEAIIRRVKSRGNEIEKKEIADFYNIPISELS